MIKKEKLRILHLLIMGITTILMVITLLLQLLSYDVLRHIILCSCILALIIMILLIERFLKNEKKMMVMYGRLYVVWLLNLVITLFAFSS